MFMILELIFQAFDIQYSQVEWRWVVSRTTISRRPKPPLMRRPCMDVPRCHTPPRETPLLMLICQSAVALTVSWAIALWIKVSKSIEPWRNQTKFLPFWKTATTWSSLIVVMLNLKVIILGYNWQTSTFTKYFCRSFTGEKLDSRWNPENLLDYSRIWRNNWDHPMMISNEMRHYYSIPSSSSSSYSVLFRYPSE